MFNNKKRDLCAIRDTFYVAADLADSTVRTNI